MPVIYLPRRVNLPENLPYAFRFGTSLCIAHMVQSALAVRVGRADPYACQMAHRIMKS
ncbi:hypothetical protein PENSPDRAFT_649329 [Peniophora sp. CONT]|nr:hypothetical protein PENSPDRAFT_649329 [Peniophora sp. CONT]